MHPQIHSEAPASLLVPPTVVLVFLYITTMKTMPPLLPHGRNCHPVQRRQMVDGEASSCRREEAAGGSDHLMELRGENRREEAAARWWWRRGRDARGGDLWSSREEMRRPL